MSIVLVTFDGTFHSSVDATLVVVYPPKAIADEVVPPPAKLLLAVFKSFTSAHVVPFQSSVLPVLLGVAPPKAKASV